MKKVLAIDPGLHWLGYSIMTSKDTILDAGVVRIRGQHSWDERLPLVLDEVFRVYRKHLPTHLVMEVPEYWSGMAGFAARESGSVFKLTFLVGALYGIFSHNDLAIIKLLTPSQWKGQLKKSVAHQRLFRKVPSAKKYEDTKEDTLDAICLGHVFFGGVI